MLKKSVSLLICSLVLISIIAIVVTATFVVSSSSTNDNDDYKNRFLDFKDTAADNEASWKMFDRIVIIPDLHGDYQKLVSILVGSRLAVWKNETVTVSKLVTDENTGESKTIQEDVKRNVLKWSATRTLAIQLGDMVDRGPYDKEVMDLAMDMQSQAAQFGDGATARFAVILGNHEILQLQNLTHYAHRDSALAYGGRGARQQELSQAGVQGQWLRTLPLIVEAWDTVFVHAGLTKHVAELGVQEINRLAKRDLDINHRREGPFIFEDSGPVWTRLMVYGASKGDCRLVEECLELVNRKRIVVGHTPQRQGPALMCDEKLLAADVGLSRWMYNGQSIVEMVRDTEVVEDQKSSSKDSFPVAFNELLPEEDELKQQQEEAELLRKQEEEALKKIQEQEKSTSGDENTNNHNKDQQQEHTPLTELEQQLKNDPSALEEIMQVMHEQRNQRRHREDDEIIEEGGAAPSPDL